MSTPKKESAKTSAKSPAKKPASKKTAAAQAEEKETKVTKAAPAARKPASKPAAKKPVAKPVEEVSTVPVVDEPDDFDIMMGLAPAPEVQPEEEDTSSKANKETKSREKRKIVRAHV